jgi:hypothetical protein
MDSVCQASQTYHGCGSFACRPNDLVKSMGERDAFGCRWNLFSWRGGGDSNRSGDTRFQTAYIVIWGAFDKYSLLLAFYDSQLSEIYFSLQFVA